MSIIKRTARRSFHLLIGLYPAGFRRQYGHELEAVFEDLLSQAAESGAMAMLKTWGCELLDLPGNLLREYVDDIRRRKNMAPISTSTGNRLPLVGALGFGVAFAFEGLIYSLFRMGIGAGTRMAGIIIILAFLMLPALAAGWLGAFALGRVINPALARKAGWWSGLAYMLVVMITSPGIWDLVTGDLIYIPPELDTAMIFIQPVLIGVAMSAATAYVLRKESLLLAMLLGGAGFGIGFIADRLLLIAIEAATMRAGQGSALSTIAGFVIGWAVSYSLVGLLGGMGLGVGLARPRFMLDPGSADGQPS